MMKRGNSIVTRGVSGCVFFPQKLFLFRSSTHRFCRRARKGDAVQVSKEERWVAGGQQAAAYIRDEKNEEDHRVTNVVAVSVDLKEGSDQDHGGPSGADQAGDHCSECEKPGVYGRDGAEVSLELNDSRDYEEAAEDDEWKILSEQGVFEDGEESGYSLGSAVIATTTKHVVGENDGAESEA